MEKKEAYRHILPHFQKPGQAYFVTWLLKDAIPAKSLVRYTLQLKIINSQIDLFKTQTADQSVIDNLKIEYNLVRKKYIKAFHDQLDNARNPYIDLSRQENTQIIIQTLQYWEGEKLKNIAFSIMPNHVHWVFELFKTDKNGKPVFLQDILQSVKRFSAHKINKSECRQGALWQKESFDTTLRDENHMYYAVRYTLNNPIKAGLVSEWSNWPGTWNGYTDL